MIWSLWSDHINIYKYLKWGWNFQTGCVYILDASILKWPHDENTRCCWTSAFQLPSKFWARTRIRFVSIFPGQSSWGSQPAPWMRVQLSPCMRAVFKNIWSKWITCWCSSLKMAWKSHFTPFKSDTRKPPNLCIRNRRTRSGWRWKIYCYLVCRSSSACKYLAQIFQRWLSSDPPRISDGRADRAGSDSQRGKPGASVSRKAEETGSGSGKLQTLSIFFNLKEWIS